MNDAVDILLICALKDEYDQVLEVCDGLAPPGWTEIILSDGWLGSLGVFNVASGGNIKILCSWSSHMGRESIQAVASTLIKDMPVQCIAMSGICAGRRGKVALGDVIFAEQMWSYDAGKIVVEDGKQRFQGDMCPYHPPSVWIQRMQKLNTPPASTWLSQRPLLPLENQENWVLVRIFNDEDPRSHENFKIACPNWKEVIQRLIKRKWLNKSIKLTRIGREKASELALYYPNSDFPLPARFQMHIAPMATGAAVIEDSGIFPRLAKSMRKVLGVDMEASALGALGDRLGVPVIVAKGVSDYGDTFKDDRYRNFAARAAAECLIALLRKGADLLPYRIEKKKSFSDRFFTNIQIQFDNELNKEEYIIPKLEISSKIDERGKESRNEIEINDLINSPDNQVVIAPSGTGKSCLLNYIGQTIICNANESRCPITIPIKIHIADLIYNNQRKIEDIVYERCKLDLNEYNLENMNVVWLLDGLDQLKFDTDYGRLNEILSGSINLISKIGSKYKIIIASRPTYERRLHGVRSGNFKRIYLMPFDDSRIREFLGPVYYAIMASNISLGLGEEILSIPILLKMIRNLYYHTDTLGKLTSRYGLYKCFTESIFKNETQKKHLDSDDKNDVIKGISYVSRCAFEQGFIGSIPMQNVDNYLNPDPGHIKRDQLKAWCIIHDIVEEGDASFLRYTHQSFQEFFASISVYDALNNFSKKTNNEVSSFIHDHLEYFHWDEVWAFVLDRIKDGEISDIVSNREEAKNIRNIITKGTSKITKRLASAPEVYAMVLGPVSPGSVAEKMNEMLLIRRSHWRDYIAAYFLWKTPSELSVAILKSIALDKDLNSHDIIFHLCINSLISITLLSSDTALIEITIERWGDYQVFDKISTALGKRKSKQAYDFFSNLLINYQSDDQYHHDHIRSVSAEELGNIGSNEAFDLLVNVLNDDSDSPSVRSSSARAISKIDPIKSQKILNGISENGKEHQMVRYVSACMLKKLDKQGKYIIPNDIVENKEPTVRFLTAIYDGHRYSVPVRPNDRNESQSNSKEIPLWKSISFDDAKSQLENRTSDNELRIDAAKILANIDHVAAKPILISIVIDNRNPAKLRWIASQLSDYAQQTEAIPFLEDLVKSMYLSDSGFSRSDRFDIEFALSKIVPGNYLINNIDFLYDHFYSAGGSTSLARLIFSRIDKSKYEFIISEYCKRMLRENIESDQFYSNMVSFFMLENGRRFLKNLTGVSNRKAS